MRHDDLTPDKRRQINLRLMKGIPTNQISDEVNVPESLVIEELKRQDRQVQGND